MADTTGGLISDGQGDAIREVNTKTFVLNQEDATVSVIDTSTNTVASTIPVGGNPLAVAFG